MVKITVSADCGNSPGKLFLKDFHIALANGDMEFTGENLADDILWQIPDDKDIHGKAAVVQGLKQRISQNAAELTLKTIITHGKDAAVNGERTVENGRKYAFGDVYVFKGAKGNTIQSITAFVIEVK